MWKRFSLGVAALALGCGESAFLVVDVGAPSGFEAPEFDAITVRILAEIDGAAVEKTVQFQNEAERDLPTSFFLEFDGKREGTPVTLSVTGVLGGEDVFSASGSAEVGGEVALLAEFCGDGILQDETRGETCEDSNRANGDGCRDDCTLELCGDGITDPQEECDGGAGCRADCTLAVCGDGLVDDIEFCDDGNNVDDDGCDADCSAPEPIDIATGGDHTCALFEGGLVKCWGANSSGQLGYGNTQNVLSPADVGFVDVGGRVIQLSLGVFHTCALLDTGNVRCWGSGNQGRLGYGNSNNIGDNESPASAGDVNVGGQVIQVSAGDSHTCAILVGGSVRCWGSGIGGALGYGNENNIGDNELPAGAGDVSVGFPAVQLSTGRLLTCARSQNGQVRCWGLNTVGQLGLGNKENIGDDELPSSVEPVNIGLPVSSIDSFEFNTCAATANGKARCWGFGILGVLGYGEINVIGDNETPVSEGNIDVGGDVLSVQAGLFNICALLNVGTVRCWLDGLTAGYGEDLDVIGDNESPASVGDVPVGFSVRNMATGRIHTCAISTESAIRCWGDNRSGQLGYGNTISIGDNETPESVGDVILF